MAVEKETRREALQYLKGRVLSLGYPDGLSADDLKDCDLTVVDVVQHKGCEVIADLNYPHDFGEFDLVLDPGTIEHCMNIGQAMVNACNAVRVGGHIIHTPPLSMVNHGYFNLCPSFFHDFYEANSFRLLRFDVMDLAHNLIDIGRLYGRIRIPSETFALVVGERVGRVPVSFAIQRIWKAAA